VKGLHFSKIELKNWKNFTKVEVGLTDRVFIIGPNASGKSNFLDAFRFLRDLVLEGGGLAKAVSNRGSMGRLRSLYARANTDVSIKVDVLDEDGRGWQYQLSFNQQDPEKKDKGKKKNGHEPNVVVSSEAVSKISKDGKIENVFTRPDSDDERDPRRLLQIRLPQTSYNEEFRELADFFQAIFYLHLVPQVVKERQGPLQGSIGEDPYGRDLLDRIRNADKRDQKTRLAGISKILNIVVPEFEKLALTIDNHGKPHLQVKFRHWRANPANQNETQFSDGTLRLIGLLWALQERDGLLLLEEPEISLHTEIIRRMAPFIARARKTGIGRQVIVSTHSEDLLSDEGIGPGEVLIVRPAQEGSEIIEASSKQSIVKLMQSGLNAGEVIMPEASLGQLSMFDKAGL
jgi:predicted ATPase